MKRIIFQKWLVEKIRNGEANVTFRTRRHQGFYEIYTGNWRRPSTIKKAGLIIKIYDVKLVKTSELKDEDVRMAGVENVEKFRELMVKFYGYIPDVLWMHRFSIDAKL